MSRRWLALAATVLAATAASACVRTDAVVCKDGQVCPSGRVCVNATPEVTVCAAPDQGQCLARADGELCAAAARCYDHVCLPIVCGDRLVDPGAASVDPAEVGLAAEACDDGNTQGDDGCSADCRSDERCGTGVVDPAHGEVCDDGNRVAHDGCSLDCELETTRWSRLEAASPVRADPSVVFDPIRGRVAVVGGSENDAATMDWSGQGWTVRASQFSPAGRLGQAAAYDLAHQELVLHGGLVFGKRQAETWTLGHAGWELKTGSPPGAPQAEHAMAYDPVRERVVLFGGSDDSGLRGDTWEWDGENWTEMPSGLQPSARSRASMAFDPGRGTIVLFGGVDGVGAVGDTWEWNGTTWALLATTGPTPRAGAALASYHGGLLLYGGTFDTRVDDREIWRWQGGAWSLLGSLASGPGAGAGMATDLLRDRVVLFGGTTLGEIWEWDGAGWSAVSFDEPAPTQHPAVAFDARRGRSIVVGNVGGMCRTYELVDEAWRPLAQANLPFRSRHRLVYDVARDEVVLFGGEGGLLAPGLLNATWVLPQAGPTTTWVQRTPTLSPSPRDSAGFAYDVSRSRAVMFGGRGASGPVGDTWEWDGAAWRDVSPTSGAPVSRAGHVLAYDPIRRTIVLFGGDDRQGSVLGDLWEWNGTAWSEINPTGERPLPRSNATLTWNPNRRRLTLIGGVFGQLALDDSWEWDAAAVHWKQVSPELRPPVRSEGVTTPASDGTGLIRFGGMIPSLATWTAEMWRFRWEGSRADEQCGGRMDVDGDGLAGCADPDCWARCSPLCSPGTSCVAGAPRCGDGAQGPRETCQLCPTDVTACPVCGDLLCEGTDTRVSCPGDCPAP